MTLSYEDVNATRRGRGRLTRPLGTAAGAGVLLGTAVVMILLLQIGYTRQPPRYLEYVYFVGLPVAACVGVLVLALSLVGPPRRAWRAALACLAVLFAAAWAVLGVPGLRWGARYQADTYALIACLLAGSMVHTLLGINLWRTGRRALPNQAFVLAVLAPLVTLAPFASEDWFEASRRIPGQMLPVIGPPYYARGLVLRFVDLFPSGLGRTANSSVYSDGVSTRHLLLSVLTLWAVVVMAWVIVAAVRDAVAARRERRQRSASGA